MALDHLSLANSSQGRRPLTSFVFGILAKGDGPQSRIAWPQIDAGRRLTLCMPKGDRAPSTLTKGTCCIFPRLRHQGSSLQLLSGQKAREPTPHNWRRACSGQRSQYCPRSNQSGGVSKGKAPQLPSLGPGTNANHFTA